jgi:hypothetical protein
MVGSEVLIGRLPRLRITLRFRNSEIVRPLDTDQKRAGQAETPSVGARRANRHRSDEERCAPTATTPIVAGGRGRRRHPRRRGFERAICGFVPGERGRRVPGPRQSRGYGRAILLRMHHRD